jgi:hypothetical protein
MASVKLELVSNILKDMWGCKGLQKLHTFLWKALVLYLVEIDDVFCSEVAAGFRSDLMYFRQELLDQVLIYSNYLISFVSFRLNRIINGILRII